jgi:hypothetical protein
LPPSDFVGLELKTSILALPERYSPPTNSLPPRLCVPLAGEGRGDCWGDGASRNSWAGKSVAVEGARFAPGLNENAGRADEPWEGVSSVLPAASAARPGSIADLGRLPVAREYEDGAEADIALGGKTNGGFGGGGCAWAWDRGDNSGVSRGSPRPRLSP